MQMNMEVQMEDRPSAVVSGVPSRAALTARQEAFCVAYASTGVAVDAYRAAYACMGSSHATVRVNACRLLQRPAVAARVRELQDAVASRGVRDTAALVADLQELVDADPGELVRVETGCCRHCYAAVPGGYQWVNEAEYARACDRALSEGGALPSMAGGFGFDHGREASPDCIACFGQGVPRVTFGSTVDASPGARRLLRGVETWPDGRVRRVHLADQMQARIELHRLRGLHVDRSVSLTLNSNVPASFKDMTTEQALKLLERVAPTTKAAPSAREPITIDAEPSP